jgi:hypothetical protein
MGFYFQQWQKYDIHFKNNLNGTAKSTNECFFFSDRLLNSKPGFSMLKDGSKLQTNLE